MSIANGIPAVGNVNVDQLGLNGAGLTGISGPLLPDPNAQASTLPFEQKLTDPQAGTTISASAPAIDPLTPLALNATGAAALAAVVGTAAAALQSVHGVSTSDISQLLQSPGFQLLFEVLGGSDSADSATSSALHLTDLLNAPGAAGVTATGNPSASRSAVNPTPYFQKLLGELESTYQTGHAAPFSASELDLFLKWLSFNGSSSVAASA